MIYEQGYAYPCFFKKESTMQSTLFNTIPLSEEVLNAVKDMDYTQMTQIQKEAIPLILEGFDIIGRSSTGTGKTAAFGIPAVEMTWEEPTNRPRILVLCPTRELATQISDEIKKYAKYKPVISVATIYGGQSMEIQIRQLKRANIVIGTPGRIMDHMRRRTLKLEKIKMVILDEADEMLNMGFYEDIKLILSEAPEERQTVLFSATMPPAIMKITKEFQKDPKLIAVDNEAKTVDTITQYCYQVPQGKKIDAVKLLLSYHKPARSLIFCNTKKMVDELVDNLNDDGYKSIGLHGDMKQNVRNKVMQDYKSGKIEILIATDVAARGIDVTDIDAVFNYDIPLETEYYVHRIGRTARAGKEGAAYTLVANKIQMRKMMDIQRFMKAEVKMEELPSGNTIDKMNRDTFSAKLKKAIDDKKYESWTEFVDGIINEQYDAKNLAAALMGMLSEKDKSIMPSVKNIIIKSEHHRNDGERSFDTIRNVTGASKVLVSVNIGRKENIAPNFIVGAIVEETGISSKRIGKIEIYSDNTTVELLKEDADIVIERMNDTRIKNKVIRFTLSDKKPEARGSNRNSYQGDRDNRSARSSRSSYGKSDNRSDGYSKSRSSSQRSSSSKSTDTNKKQDRKFK